jgi:DNA/RNA-binding domain of Phe-tRNA-synthetase-like protein
MDLPTTSLWTYRIGYHEESYLTLSGQVKSAQGKLVVADQEGVIGSPVAYSSRAAIIGEPDNVMVIAYLPLETTTREVEHIVREIESAFTSIFESEMVNIRVLM